MKKEDVIRIRKELHNLAGEGRHPLPIRVMGPTTNYNISEADACFLWDDANEILYIVRPNTTYTQTTDSRLYPMNIMTMDYESITYMSVPVDRLSLDHFFKDKVAKGLTNEETRKRYFTDMTRLFEGKTYMMGQPSTTTEKRGLRPDDEIIHDADTHFL